MVLDFSGGTFKVCVHFHHEDGSSACPERRCMSRTLVPTNHITQCRNGDDQILNWLRKLTLEYLNWVQALPPEGGVEVLGV